LLKNQDANDAARGDLIGATRASHQEAEPGKDQKSNILDS